MTNIDQYFSTPYKQKRPYHLTLLCCLRSLPSFISFHFCYFIPENMAEVVGLLLSPFLQVFFEKVTSREFVDFFRSRKLDSRLLKRLERVLLSANAVLEDAEELQFTELKVKNWLDELKDAIYDAEDILDEIHTEVLRCNLDAEFQTFATKVRKTFPTSLNPFVRNIEPKIKDILETLDHLVNQKDDIGLKEGVGVKSSGRSSASLVKESDIFGRTDDKEAIINLLLSDDVSGNELYVIAIVGMGGLGKTTLAQLVYNDDRMEGHFDHKAWVCVSDDFDVLKMTKTILQNLESSTISDSKSLDWLQVTLQQKLRGKKFLLVLDDVWNKNIKNYSEWEAFSNPFRYGAEGIRVIVTTREKPVASIMQYTAIYDLKTLQDDDCWSLFSKHAFHSGNSDAHPELEVIGRKIVERCKGLPLAVKTIGALLWSELDVKEWNKIMMSEIWDLQSDIIPALRLSYKYLPLHLKCCFAYCSIFPKDYDFEKEELILLWMAEGFLPQGKDKTAEQIGDDYFADLVSRSLFQQSSKNTREFGMHDLVNDLARFVSGQFTFRLEGENSLEIGSKTRHLSFFKRSTRKIEKFGVLYEATGLRTFLPIYPSNQILAKELAPDLLPMLRCLRVLNLSSSLKLTELPDSIGKMKHLRHLDVSLTPIRKLPDSICKLCNLQTLRISLCNNLTVLPRDIHKLINLRHLDVSDTPIKEMPVHLGRLCCLRTLTKFIVGEHSGAGIGELGKLANLGGKLLISDLQNVVSPLGALVPSLNDKIYLEELKLRWNGENNISESQRAVLDSLQPHVNLKRLSIYGYGGKRFSDWVGHHSFSNIATLYLYNCGYCSVLPPLGQLPTLQSLSIDCFAEIDAVDRDFYGNSSSSTKPFGALKVLKFRNMPKLEKWFAFGVENEGGAFTHLEELEIVNCPRLTGELPIHPSSLSRLVIEECPLLVTSLPSAATLRQLELRRNCNEALFKQLPTGLQKLAISEFDALESIPERLMDFNSCLEELKIRGGHSLISLSSAGLPSTLNILEIIDCRKLELPMHLNYSSLETLMSFGSFDSLKSFPLNLFPNLTSIVLSGCLNLESFNVPQQLELDLVALSSLQIHNCPNFVSFPNGGLRASKLVDFYVTNCQSLTSLPDKMHILLPSLGWLYLENCPEVGSFPEGGLPSKLSSIFIIGCDKLIANRGGWGFQNLPSIRYIDIHGNCKDVESFPDAGLLPTNLVSLVISKFPNMKSLDYKALRHLTSLDQLSIYSCPKLKFMKEEGLPASISTLRISECALLEKQLESRKGKARSKIDHIPYIDINGKLI
ncbi:putative disease resistance protein At3g14460 [Carya illinoinensis]|nr:putative disease resistance protein At3g14460 [Carya illinoinensis]XP_042955987.1 putative disease resistance protein At3g14460 [Carya illinoinensis]XP_042955988.1 putative disease resistance protein At3g14460 [Carya illinoinensis]XP_042955989.1 putative disease resistance protein At3g14460 [Carya illinoinensis]XP_042955990.1 putative disease resistance protein At3g14460 [Carya illinoinensis]XP_042955991.1 putative disease resistance protein At3g14460 [Carya illinoinensis]XP_042955993.1 pu